LAQAGARLTPIPPERAGAGAGRWRPQAVCAAGTAVAPAMAVARPESSSRPSSSAPTSFRLLLSDGLSAGALRVRTFSGRPTSLDEVVSHLCEHFDFRDLCVQRGLEPEGVKVPGGGFHVVGFDGPRRVTVRNDDELAAFLTGLRHTPLPSVEVRVAKAGPQPKAAEVDAASGGERQTGRMARDAIEKMEDQNSALLRSCERIERRLEELERVVASNKVENQGLINVAVRDLQMSQEKVVKSLRAEMDGLRKKDSEILDDLDVVRQHSFKVEEQDKRGQEELQAKLDELKKNMEIQFEDVAEELQKCRDTDDCLRIEDERQNEELLKHDAELARLEKVKVDVDVWREAEQAMDEYLKKEFARTDERITATKKELDEKLDKERSERVARDNELQETIDKQVARIDSELKTLTDNLEAGLKRADERLAATKAELEKHTLDKVRELKDSTDASFSASKADVAAKDAAINTRVSELTSKCDKTFEGVNERMEEMVRVERARLGNIEKDLVESTTVLRADCRSEIERVRNDYEQEAARLDADLGDLHTKNDVTKQEINFFQSRLLEQREWAQRQLTETATATRAGQVDAQEGLAAAMKMLHALRDDAVGFREKMAKFISSLQHCADTQGDSISSLESHRSRMRLEIDSLMGAHQNYTSDMDGWANDVRIKVERIFRALEPPRVEWRIPRAHQRARELKRPLAVKSPSFNLRGLRNVQMEFYPDGTNNSPPGQAIVRLFLPPNAQVRYQCWVGSSTPGPQEYLPGGNLSVDLPIEEWKDQIQDDGAVQIVMEVLRDMNNDDESLSREVRVESP